jgi:glycosyltransferase involved in cell wall biosynthesis
MKILQITYNLGSGGAERLVVDLSNELSKIHEVLVLTMLDDTINENDFLKSELNTNISYICAKEKRGFFPGKIIRLYKIVKEISPDIVHFHGKGLIFFFIPSIFLFRKPKYIETLHTKADVIFKFKILSFFIKLIYKSNLVSLCTISDENKRSLEKVSGIMNSYKIYNGRKINNHLLKKNSILQEVNALKKNKNDIVFIHIGRCVPEKNQRMLINAFNKMAEKKLNYILIIIGSSFNSDLGNELTVIANPKIHFLGTRHNVFDYLLCSDAFCLTSFYEGMPITLIEAIACNCIPISTPVSGVVDVICDNVTGFISKDFSEISYIRTIETFLQNRFTINKEKLNEIFLKYFSIEKCAENYNELYYKLITGK